MTKMKVSYSCNQCGALSHKWSGQCMDCQAWNSISEIILTNTNKSNRFAGYRRGKTIDLGPRRGSSLEA